MAAARDIAAAIPGAGLRTLPGTGHFLTRDVWAVYAGELRALADRAATCSALWGNRARIKELKNRIS